MKTKIKSVHEETYSNGKTVGVLSNFSLDEETKDWKESFIYIYREGMYIFFETIVDMVDYLLYGEKKMKRAYMEEDTFDRYFDSEHIDGKFTDALKWD